MHSTTTRTAARFTVTKIGHGICSFTEQDEGEMRNALRYHKSLRDRNVVVEFSRGTAYRVSKGGIMQINMVVCYLTLDGAHSIRQVHDLLVVAKPRYVAVGPITVRVT